MNTKSAPFENVPDNKFYRTIAIVVAIAIVAIALVVVVPKVVSGGKTASGAVGEAVDNVKDNATGPIADAMRNDPAYDGSPVTTINNPDHQMMVEKGMDKDPSLYRSVSYKGINWYFSDVDGRLGLYAIAGPLGANGEWGIGLVGPYWTEPISSNKRFLPKQ